MYFGALAVGADIAGGIQVFYFSKMIGKEISFAFKGMNAEFIKRAESDIIFESTLTDSQGLASLSWNNHSTGQMYLTITKKNYRPLEHSIQITDEALYAYNVYQIEGEGKNLFSEIKGDNNTIMGLPIKKIKEYLDTIK